MKKLLPLIWLLFICQEAPVLAVTQITDSLYVKQGAKITRLYTDSAALRTMTLSGSPIGTPGDSCMFLNLGVPVHCTKAQVLAWLGSSGITSINTGTAAAHTIVGEQGLQVLDSGTNLYKHVIVPATGYIIPTGSNMRVDSTTLADSAADAGKWGGNVYGGPYLGLHATADTAIAADRARKLATTRTIGKSTTFDGTANIVPDSAVSVVQATQLTTARTIGNTSFNGTANIIPDTCNKANRARYADSSGATHKADTSISSHQSAQLTTAVNIGNVSFNGTAAIIPDTANKANRARYSDSTGKIPDTVHIRLGLSANNINVSNVQTTNLNGTAIGSAYSVVGADQSGAAAARQAAYANLTSIGSLANASGWLNNNGSGGFAYSTPPGTWASNFGTTVGTICQGNDSRLSDSRAPNGSASGDLSGSYPGPTVAKIKNNTVPVNANGSLINDGSGNLSWAWPTYTNVGADQSGAAAARQAAYTNLTSIGSLTNALGWLKNNGSGTFSYSTPSYSDVGASPALSLTTGYIPKAASATTLGNSPLYTDGTNVGLGTTSPTSLLDIAAHSHQYSDFQIMQFLNGADILGGIKTLIYDATIGAEKSGLRLQYANLGTLYDGLSLTYQGNVGLGTTSPTSLLDIAAHSHQYSDFQIMQFLNGADILGGIKTLIYDATIGAEKSGLRLQYANLGTLYDGLSLTYQGNVGIGTTSPDSQFTTSAGAHIGGGLLVGGATTINNNVEVGGNCLIDGYTEYSSLFTAFNSTETAPIIYCTALGGTYPFSENGNLILQGRPSTGRDILMVPGGTTTPGFLVLRNGNDSIPGNIGVNGTATIENNIVLGDYGGIPGFYMKSDNLSIGSQTGGLYGQITSNGWSIQSEITAPSMNVSGNDTVGGQIRAGGLYTTGYDTSYYGYTHLTTANQMVVDTFNIRHQEKLYDSIATMTTTFTFDCAHMRPLCTMTSATAGGTVSFINISDGLVFIFINATANSINLTLTYGTVGLGAHQGMTLICSQTSIFEEL